MRSPAVQIERQSSIEREPRTLSLAQFQYAREAALSVLSTRTIEEALRIFTEGLEPVASAKREEDQVALDTDEEWDDSISHAPLHPPATLPLRDVVTAPF